MSCKSLTVYDIFNTGSPLLCRILVYPPSGTGAINITQGDLNRLEDGEYLNDTLIEFGLKWVSYFISCPHAQTLTACLSRLWLNEIRAKNPDLADQIHVFSSFFYKKLKNNTKK
jgi:Ulp1 family protease